MTYVYIEHQTKDITVDAYRMLKPFKDLVEEAKTSIVFV